MTVQLSTRAPERFAADLLIVPVTGEPARSETVVRLDRRLHGRLLAEARRLGFRGAAQQELVYQVHDDLAVSAIVLIGVGADPAIGVWYEVAEAVTRYATRSRARRAGVALGDHGTRAVVHAVAEGIALARYRFDAYRSTRSTALPVDVALLLAARAPGHQRALTEAGIYARATALARDLANTPAADLTPLDFARAARRLAGPRLRVRVHDARALARMRMGAILTVGRGSDHPPCLIELAYRPPGARGGHVALVGKGITFDSGGLSIKTADAMQTQKRDMAGGAVVLGVMSALPALRLPIAVRAYIPSAENMPSGRAMRPGDVLRVYDGTTVEVLNTDAEGRLVLADALAYAASRRPSVMFDFATLTAAVRNALGPRCAGVLGTDRAAVAGLLAAAAETDELLWELPLIGAYRRDLESRVADLKNIGEGHAGTIVAALFLREFVAGVPWAHVDFSSTVMSDGYPCHPKGASGYGVRTMLRCLTRLAADAAVPARRRRSR